MKRKTTKQTPKPIFSTEKDYWDAYIKKSLSYKAIDLHNWKKHFQKVLAKDSNSVIAQNMLQRCLEEEKILVSLKEEADKKSDELLLVKESSGSPKKPKR